MRGRAVPHATSVPRALPQHGTQRKVTGHTSVVTHACPPDALTLGRSLATEDLSQRRESIALTDDQLRVLMGEVALDKHLVNEVGQDALHFA